jgi:S-methylmethionine-dependent homocysteine/selenocysteine methylase
MTRYESLMHRIRSGDRILIDGATGSEVERRGVPELEHAWTATAALSHPDILREVHEDYIRCGARIVISNTFATSLHALRDAGREADFEALNRRAVELAVEARERTDARDVLVAGGISYWSWSGDHPSLEALRGEVAEQAEIMADAGADLLMLEMMVDIDRMLVTLEAAQASGLPVWVGFSCKPDDTGTMCLWRGEPLADALAALAGRGVPLVSIMHTEVQYIDGSLDVALAHWQGPLGVYAHSSSYSGGEPEHEATISPADYAAAASRWLDRGVQVIGSCCGLGVDHVKALSEVV